jgi:outer membrane protein
MNKVLAAAALVALTGPAQAETLADAIASACAGNPVLAAARARQDALAETPEQARAGGRLTAAADAAGGYDKFDYGKGGTGTVSANLPIWTGGRVPSAVRAASGDVASGAQALRDTEASVLETVISAYANLLYDQQAVEIAQADIALLDNQVADSRARFKLGNATRTDVARLEAQRAGAAATLAGAQSSVANDLADYHAAVGHDAGRLADPPMGLAALPGTIDQARARAVADNPLYQSSLRAADAAAARIDQARANGAPSLSLGGAYGYDADLARGSDRYFPRTANAGLVLHVPILTGGLVASEVRQARADRRAAEYDSDAQRREAIRGAESAWAALASAHAQTEANAQAVTAADLALKGVRAEYQFGLRSTLDILVADESLRGAQLAFARSRADALLAEAALLRATGRLDQSAFPGGNSVAAS